jgi:glycosyltransferase involved in cell wall biosynthesis
MKKVLLSAFACDPTRGSEPSCGWNWAEGLARKGFEVHCITRETSRAGIETQMLPPNLKFNYVRLPFGMENLYGASQPAMYLYYILWQWKAYKLAKALHKANGFDMTHHVTWGNLQLGSFMYKLGIPLVFGPAGGGQMAPAAFKEYFGEAWTSEQQRERVSRLLLRFNPACNTMLKKAAVVLASNEDTLRIAKSKGAGNISLALDVGVPDWFFPKQNAPKVLQESRLKLLWVGRFMPRKGLMLLLDVMKELKDYPGITLTVVGDGITKEAFLDRLKQYALEDTVHWKGRVPFSEVGSEYADHDVFLFTSLRESGGVQLVEAMAYGMPVVTLDLHGPGLIVDANRGFKCACGTPAIAIESLKAAILALYDSPDLVGRLSQGSYEFAASQGWQKRIDTTVSQFYC